MNGVTTVYVGNYLEKSGETLTKYFYAGSTRIAMRTNTAEPDWILTDHLGSTSVVANYDGTSPAVQLYRAWGEKRYPTGPSTLPTTYRYTGQRQEVSLGGADGLYYYGARWYDSYLGRFIQADTVILEPGDPSALDRFAYVLNNPLVYNDPSGHDAWSAIGQFATGFVFEFARSNAWMSPQAQEALAVNVSESSAMLAGRVAADIAAIAIGVTETVSGVGIGFGGTAVACGATLCIGAAATVAGGAAVTALGVTTAMAGASGLGGNLARMSENRSNQNTASRDSKMLGEKGTQFTSKTLWTGKQGRLDVENPAPGQRPGQIHFQQGKYKWYYDPITKSFLPDKVTGIKPPAWLLALLQNDQFNSAVQRGLYYLGE